MFDSLWGTAADWQVINKVKAASTVRPCSWKRWNDWSTCSLKTSAFVDKLTKLQLLWYSSKARHPNSIIKGLYNQRRKANGVRRRQREGQRASESDRKCVLPNHCSAAVITLSPLVTVLLSELVCNTRVISPNDLSRLPHLRTSECGWHEWRGGGTDEGGEGRKMINIGRKEQKKEKAVDWTETETANRADKTWMLMGL